MQVFAFVYGGRALAFDVCLVPSRRDALALSSAAPPSFFSHSNHTSVAHKETTHHTTPPSQPRLRNENAPNHITLKLACQARQLIALLYWCPATVRSILSYKLQFKLSPCSPSPRPRASSHSSGAHYIFANHK